MANTINPKRVWNINAGGLPAEEDESKSLETSVRAPRGIFAAFPGATPKYAINKGEQEKDFRETMARMFMQVPKYEDFLNEFAEDPELKQIAAVLGGQATADAGTVGGAGYIDFLLQGVQHSFQEKSQVVEVLADDHVAYFFGQAATTFAYNGILINTKQDDQAINMLRLYSAFGRGSQLAARKTLLSLRYDGMFVSGVMTNLTYSLNAETEMMVPFSFNLLVKQLQVLPNPYSGLVSLSTPFAAASDGYMPFSQGSLDPGTKPTSPAAAPSATVKVAITPAASEKKAQDKEDADIAEGQSILHNMKTAATTLFGF